MSERSAREKEMMAAVESIRSDIKKAIELIDSSSIDGLSRLDSDVRMVLKRADAKLSGRCCDCGCHE